MLVTLRQMVLTLSRAVDLVGVTDVFHGRRVGMMAVECAKALGCDAATRHLLFDAGLLHDCGVSSTREHHVIVNEFDWDGMNLHCEKGYELLHGFPPLAHLAPLVRYHHTHWAAMPGLQIDPLAASHANLIHLVDRVDALANPYYQDESLLLHVGEIRDLIHRYRGQFFAPELVDAFLDASAPEAFWLQLDPAYIPQYINEMGRFTETRASTLAELKQFAFLIAHIVDAKSHFTAEHSIGVARLSRFLGQLAGFSGEHLEKLEIAALLHDIGKLQVPDDILESQTALSPAEFAIMKKHSFATYQILRQVGGFEELALWAAQHHESPDGSGYPFHLKGDAISIEARIIKIADIYQALAQNRPYRKSTPAAEILGLLRKMQANSEVDGALVDRVALHLDEYHSVAQGEMTH
jgi:putative nucleotidyltransferase with HDIG domain